MPGTAKDYGVDVNDPTSSIRGAAHYLSDNLKTFGGNQGLATAAYNWGPGNVQNWMKGGGDVPAETQNYVNTITGKQLGDWRGAGGTSARLAVPGTTLASSPVADAAPPSWLQKAMTRPAPTKDKDGNPVQGKSPLEKIASSFDKQPGEAPQPPPPQQFGPVQDPMAQMAGPAAQLFASVQAAAAKPLSWTSRPYGSGAGQQMGTTLNTAGYYG